MYDETSPNGVYTHGAAPRGVSPQTSTACPACGRGIQPTWRHCVYCGVTLARGCPRCGAPRLEVPGEAFCHACGAALQSNPDAPTIPLDGDTPLPGQE